jgi:hypothetical protein
LCPKKLVSRTITSELTLRLITDAEITVLGMDVPERVEGRPLDGIVLDEYGNMKEEVWTDHVRNALITVGRPPGWAWFIGVPEGRNHYWRLCVEAETRDDWRVFHWHSNTVITKEEDDALKAELDPMIYDQELGGSFVGFQGRIYYSFDRDVHAAKPLSYDPARPLIFCFDFNVSPGVAAVVQELPFTTVEGSVEWVTCVIDEVWRHHGSNTPLICSDLCAKWGHHEGEVLCYGDATGGAKGTAKVAGSDWDLIRSCLRKTFKTVKVRVPRENPRERQRVNAMNRRLMTKDGHVRMFVDPFKAPYTVQDLEGVCAVPNSNGEIDKSEKFKMLTHLTDALGYYVQKTHPVVTRLARSSVV